MHLLLLILTDLDFRFCFFIGYCHNWQWFSTNVLRLEKVYRKTREKIWLDFSLHYTYVKYYTLCYIFFSSWKSTINMEYFQLIEPSRSKLRQSLTRIQLKHSFESWGRRFPHFQYSSHRRFETYLQSILFKFIISWDVTISLKNVLLRLMEYKGYADLIGNISWDHRRFTKELLKLISKLCHSSTQPGL